MPELREVFEMTTKQVEPDLDSWRKQERRQRTRVRNRKIGAFVVAAAIAVVAAVLILANRPGGGGTTAIPAGEPSPPTTAPEPASQNSGAVRIAERFMAARGAHDAKEALALLSDGGATVLLLDDNVVSRNMPTVRLNRDELALALEAERLFQVRYESVECRSDSQLQSWSEAQISCSFRMDNRLRQVEGLPPTQMSIAIGVQDDRVTYLSFPWLSAGFPIGTPGEVARFVQWVEATHPEVGGIQGGFHDGTLFRIEGQEVVIKMTPDAIDLLAAYLDQYERSVGG